MNRVKCNDISNDVEEQKLQELAKRQQHEAYVKANVPNIAAQIQGMGELSFKPKEGEPLNIKFDYPNEFKAKMTGKLYDYFADGSTPINETTIGQAFKAINATYLDENFPVLAQKIFEQGYNLAEEKATNKYENRSGLQKPSNAPNPNVDVQADYGNFLKSLVKAN